MATENSIQNLFNEVSVISKKYEYEATKTGENFNMFKVLRLTRKEVKHSAFIAELLNPKGKHGKGNLFLKEFIEILKEPQNEKQEKREIGFLIDDVKCVWIEHETKGWGRIDIYLEDKRGQKIIIENKIDAIDQQGQLYRYHKYAPNAPIVYLTMDGKEPSTQSMKDEKTDEKMPREKLFLLSYKNGITKWLEKCKAIAKELPLLHVAIVHFSNSIKSITGQTINDDMKAEIIQSITASANNMSAALEIAENISGAKNKLLELLGDSIKQYIVWEAQKDSSAKWRIDFKSSVSDKYRVSLLLLGENGSFYIDIRSLEKSDALIESYKKLLDSKTQDWEGGYNEQIKDWAGVWGYTFDGFNWSELADEKKRNELAQKFVGYVEILLEAIEKIISKQN